jgi:hypothetical protein
MQVLDPHWNKEKLKQVEGRGARYMSHADLPPEERKVLVENYLATRPQGLVSNIYNKVTGRAPDKSVDEYLAQMSQNKEDLIDQFRALLPQQEQGKKTAARTSQTTEESKQLAQSWKPRIAAEAAYSLPLAVQGAGIGHTLGSLGGSSYAPGLALVGGAAGAGLGHFLANMELANLTPAGKRLAREAIRKPGKENALREEGAKVHWGDVAKSTLNHSLLPSIQMVYAPDSENKIPHFAANMAAGALGGIGTGYLDKYKRLIALNELDNQRAELAERDAAKLQRMRRQLSVLEDKVEGGWSKPTAPAEKKDAPPKDRSGKNW